MTLPGIIDVHSHALLPEWLRAVAAEQGRPGQTPQILGRPAPSWSEDEHLAMMDDNGIAASVLSWPSATECVSGGAAQDLARSMNETFAGIVGRRPRQFGAFAVLPLDDVDRMLDESVHALDVLGLDGVSCTPQMQGHYLGEARFDDWFAALDARHAVLFIHPSVPPGLDAMHSVMHPAILEFMFETTRAIANLIFSGTRRRFPNVRILCAHGGGAAPYLAHRMAVMGGPIGGLFGGNAMSREDVMADLRTFYFDLTASTAALQVDALSAMTDPSHLMLGFDFPMMNQNSIPPALELLFSNPKFGKYVEDICAINAKSLLFRSGKRSSIM